MNRISGSGELDIYEDGHVAEGVDLLIERLSRKLGVSRQLVERSIVRQVEASLYTSNRTRDPGVSVRKASRKTAPTVRSAGVVLRIVPNP